MLDQIMQSTALATWTWDLRLDKLNINEHGLALLGHSPASLPTLDTTGWNALLHPTDRTLSNTHGHDIFPVSGRRWNVSCVCSTERAIG